MHVIQHSHRTLGWVVLRSCFVQNMACNGTQNNPTRLIGSAVLSAHPAAGTAGRYALDSLARGGWHPCFARGG